MDKNVLIPISQGTEEMEAVIIIDLLRRAGFQVKVAGDNDIITCSRRVRLLPDISIDDIETDDEFDIIIFPGGQTGTKNLMENACLESITKAHAGKGKLIGAICAAPLILDQFKILKKDAKITSHPSAKVQLMKYDYSEDEVVVDGNIITGRGAGTAIQFVLKIIEIVVSEAKSNAIAKDIVFK